MSYPEQEVTIQVLRPRKPRTKLQLQLASHRSTFILRACNAANWNVRAVAGQLGMARSHLYHLINSDPGLARAWKDARGTTTTRHSRTR